MAQPTNHNPHNPYGDPDDCPACAGGVSHERAAELTAPDVPAEPVAHSHGQHGPHVHMADDYARHQQPIDGERVYPRGPCPKWSRDIPHPAHDWPAPVDGLSHCPGWPPAADQ